MSSSLSSSSSSSIQKFTLKPFEELRLESASPLPSSSSSKSSSSSSLATLHVTLLSGTCELFGSEIPLNKSLSFHDKKLAFFTFHGCELSVDGVTKVCYTSNDTKMSEYVEMNHKLMLERGEAESQKGKLDKSDEMVFGPRCLLVGSSDSGVSTLCKMFASWALRTSSSPSSPILVDLDLSSNLLSLPSCISCTPIENPISHSECGESIALKAPLCYFVGGFAPSDVYKKYSDIYYNQMERMSETIRSRMKSLEAARIGGIIIKCPSWMEQKGIDIPKIVKYFQVNHICVVGNDRLFSELDRDNTLKEMKCNIHKLSKSGGVVPKDEEMRKYKRNKAVREYFYGVNGDFSPHQKIVDFHSIQIYQIIFGNPTQSSLMPIGNNVNTSASSSSSSSSTPSYTLSKVPITPELEHSLLTVSFSTDVSALLDSNVAGFVHITKVDTKSKKITILCPAAGPLPSILFMKSNLKWQDGQ